MSFRRLLWFLTSPGLAVAVAVVGYYAFAGFTNRFLPDGSLGGNLIRLGTLALVVLAILRHAPRASPVRAAFLLPLVTFSLIYIWRLIDVFYFLGYWTPFDATRVILVFAIGGIVPALLLQRVHSGISDFDFSIAMLVLSTLFLAGVGLNLEELRASNDLLGRAGLEKINPIPMAHTALAFILYFVITIGRSKRDVAIALALTPPLLIVALFAESRGAVLAALLALAIYFFLLKGSRRFTILLGVSIAGVLVAAALGPQYFEGVTDRFALLLGNQYGERGSSADTRILAWSGAWQQFLDYPLLGRHIIEQATSFYPHNIYLEVLMSTGVLGGLAFFAHFALATRSAIGIIRSPKFGVASTFLAVLFFRDSFAAAVSFSLWGISSFWMVSTLVIALWYGRRLAVRARRNRPHTQGARQVPIPSRAIAIRTRASTL